MRSFAVVAAVSAALACAAFALPPRERSPAPQDPAPTPAPAPRAPADPDRPPDAAALLRAKQLAAPGDHHTRLQRLVGEWNVVVRSTGAAATANEQRGRVSCAAILGGRHVVANYSLTLGGAKVEAVQILGFDTLRQVYTASWRDDASTWSVEGTAPPVAETPDVLTFRGTLADALDATGRPFRQVLDLGSDRAVVVRLFETRDGVERERQTQEWTRR
jgi:hypothetical protein